MPGGIRIGTKLPSRFYARPRTDPTALDLARAIATAVLREAPRPRVRDSRRDVATQAVLRTLRRRRAWFMRFEVDGDGTIISGTERRLR